MASIRVMGFMNLILLFNPVAATVEYGFIRPTPISLGLIGIQPMAPRPTRPPSIDEINGELRKRRLPDNIYSAIPDSWCAFLDGDFGKSEAHSSSHIPLRNKASIRSDISRIASPFTCASSSSQTCVLISSYTYTSIACSPYGIDRDDTTTVLKSCLDSTKWLSTALRTSGVAAW